MFPLVYDIVETCFDLTRGLNSSEILYGGISVIKLGEFDPLSPDISWRVKQYGAEVQYTCDAKTYLLGSSTRTCNASGWWSTPRPICSGGYCGNIQSELLS